MSQSSFKEWSSLKAERKRLKKEMINLCIVRLGMIDDPVKVALKNTNGTELEVHRVGDFKNSDYYFHKKSLNFYMRTGLNDCVPVVVKQVAGYAFKKLCLDPKFAEFLLTKESQV